MAVPAAQVPLWMATFADMMALMMCFFTLLFAMSKTEEEKFKAVAGSLRAALGGVQFIQPDTPVPSPTPSLKPAPAAAQALLPSPIKLPPAMPPAARQARQAFAERLQTEINNGQLQIRAGQTPAQLLIILPEHVSFASGSARLQPAAQLLVDRLLGEAEARAHRVQIGGHTDSLPLRNSRYYTSNWDLSASRAVAVAERILARGLIASEKLSVSGFGATRPLADNGDAAGRARNRRVEILLDFADPEAPDSAAQQPHAAKQPRLNPTAATQPTKITATPVSPPPGKKPTLQKLQLPALPVIPTAQVVSAKSAQSAQQPKAAAAPARPPKQQSIKPGTTAGNRDSTSDQQRMIEALRDGGFVTR